MTDQAMAVMSLGMVTLFGGLIITFIINFKGTKKN